MRYIDKIKFKNAVEDIGWNAITQTHLDALAGLSIADKKDYIKKNRIWNQLQEIMCNLSYNKCWYADSPIGNGDFEIDHFRPKNRSKEKIDYTISPSKNITHKPNGYWWLAYEWSNYRLSGGLANKLRRDRLGDCNDVKGKGDYFPLDLVNGRVANDEESCSCEVPILLDPLEPDDVCLLTFDKGAPIPATTDQADIERVKQSIFYYHLDLEQLNRDRRIVWEDCVEQIDGAKQVIDNSSIIEKKITMKKCFRELRKLVDSERKAYTSTAKACLMLYSELEGYSWLKNLVRTI